MSDQEDVDGLGERRRRRREVFLCVKQRLLLEVDVQRGQERRRMELDSLTAVETSEAAWTRGVRGRRRWNRNWVDAVSSRLSFGAGGGGEASIFGASLRLHQRGEEEETLRPAG